MNNTPKSTKKTTALALIVGTLVVAVTSIALTHPCTWAPNPPSPSHEPEEPAAADETGAP